MDNDTSALEQGEGSGEESIMSRITAKDFSYIDLLEELEFEEEGFLEI